MKNLTFDLYEALASLVKYGNLYHRKEDRRDGLPTYWQSVTEDRPHHPLVNSETVGELVVQGLAQRAEHDPLFSLGKVVPTDEAQAALEAIVLTRETPGVGGHLSHCCLRRHGCKYSHEFCPVETGVLPPDSDMCGACYEDDAMRDQELEMFDDDDLINEIESRGYTVTKNS
jgi:hypothetical protein